MLVALAVSGVCLWYATRGTDWAGVGAVLSGAHVGWSLSVIALSICCHVLRAERWRVLLRPVADVERWPAIAATFVGFGSNALLPLRLGEIVRPVFLSRRARIPLSPTISSIVLERICDILLMLTLLLAVMVVYPVPEFVRRGAVVLAVGAVGALIFLAFAVRNRAAGERIIDRVLDVLPVRVATPLRSIAHGLLQGLSALNDGRIVAFVVVSSVALWSMIALTYTLSFLALDVQIPLLSGSLVTVVIVATFVSLPQAPGFLGTWQAGCVFALHDLFGVPKDVALGYSLLTWAIQMVANVGSGAIALMIEGVSLRELVQEGKEEEKHLHDEEEKDRDDEEKHRQMQKRRAGVPES
jgi:glycosyltransferase 2 family protein